MCNKKLSNNFKINLKYVLRPIEYREQLLKMLSLLSFSQTKVFRESVIGQHVILENHGIDNANKLEFSN